MGDMLGDALDFLEAQRHAHQTVSVVYSRGTSTVTLLATRGRASVEAVDDNGFTIDSSVPDWLIRAEDLVLAGATATPLAGDTIAVGTDLYEVKVFGSDGCYRRSDPKGVTLRVHTQQIS